MIVILVALTPGVWGAELTLAPEGGRVTVSVDGSGEFTIGPPGTRRGGYFDSTWA